MTTKQLIKIALKNTLLRYWFDKYFWKYLLGKADDPKYCSKWHRFWCRAAGHPTGPWYHNMGGYEPDMSCKECGDEL